MPLSSRAPLAIFVALAVALAACTGGPEQIAAPMTMDVSASSAVDQGAIDRELGTTAPNSKAGIVYCDLAFRNAAGRFRVKTESVTIPTALFTPDGATQRFVYVGRIAEHEDPSVVAMCAVPASTAALEKIAAVFGARDATRGRRNSHLASRSASGQLVPSADVALYEGETGTCDPTMIQCECPENDPTCGSDGGAEWEGPDPGGVEEPNVDGFAESDGSYLIDSTGAPVLLTAVGCTGTIDRIHYSTHVNYNLNVIARNSCTQSVAQSVRATLSRQSCIWFICWWSERGAGYYYGFKKDLRASAAAPCQTGWWKGTGKHEFFFGPGYWPLYSSGTTATYNRITFC